MIRAEPGRAAVPAGITLPGKEFGGVKDPQEVRR